MKWTHCLTRGGSDWVCKANNSSQLHNAALHIGPTQGSHQRVPDAGHPTDNPRRQADQYAAKRPQQPQRTPLRSRGGVNTSKFPYPTPTSSLAVLLTLIPKPRPQRRSNRRHVVGVTCCCVPGNCRARIADVPAPSGRRSATALAKP